MMARPSDATTGWAFFSMAIGLVALTVGLVSVTTLIGPASIPIWGGALLTLILIGNGPIGKALGRRISPDPTEVRGLTEVPEELYAELDDLRTRMLEMEERQEFAERLLAQRPDGQRLAAGDES